MVKLATSQNQQLKSQFANRVNGFPAENELKDLRFKLAHRLQSTLNLQTTIELFFENIQGLVTVSGLRYEQEPNDEHLFLGSEEKHSASYNVASSASKLGKVVFFRDTVFAEAELITLEMLIGILFYPLRNALLYKEALESSMRDPLTGIGNRSAMELSFEREIKLSRRHSHPLAILLIDIDHFKEINDSLGHTAGDKALQQVVNAIKITLRETDQIFRYGGEEFVALLNNTDVDNARLIAERIRLHVAMTPTSFKNEDILATISIGIGILNDGDTCDSLFEKADSAMYQAKSNGRNKVCCLEGELTTQ